MCLQQGRMDAPVKFRKNTVENHTDPFVRAFEEDVLPTEYIFDSEETILTLNSDDKNTQLSICTKCLLELFMLLLFVATFCYLMVFYFFPHGCILFLVTYFLIKKDLAVMNDLFVWHLH